MAKIITKSIHERLDNFVFQSKENVDLSSKSIETNELDSSKKKVIKKKADGLIEKMNSKIFITEDNRQLLND